jgi:alkaline phosphatase D
MPRTDRSLLRRVSRRDAMRLLGGAAGAVVLPGGVARAADKLKFRDDPFTLGVASGYPGPDTVVLWTRLAPTPMAPGGGVPADAIVPVTWEIARDERMREIVRSGVDYAIADYAHSVHVEPTGLEADRVYWYRFTAGGQRSPVGRTRTAPPRDAANARLRLAVAACQQYEHGYFLGYRHMLDDELDLIVHVGDYIYEASWGVQRMRSHDAPEAFSLDDYRARYALYRSERELQAAHAACPWLVTWDDHEVENDYAGAVSEEDDARAWFLARRAAAYQAYYEHMPLPRRALPFGADLRLYTQRTFGQLANLLLLDTRQYRSPLACTEPARRTSRSVRCPELTDPARSKLGVVQEAWFGQRMAASRAKWNLIASGTVMAYIDEDPGPEQLFWNDGWNGYPAARQRLMDALAQSRASNPIVLSGDIHSFLAARHHRIAEDRNSPVIAAEFVASSISAQGVSQRALDERRANNPNVVYANTEKRGYLRLELTPARVQVDLVGLDSVTNRDAGRSVMTTIVVEDGTNMASG